MKIQWIKVSHKKIKPCYTLLSKNKELLEKLKNNSFFENSFIENYFFDSVNFLKDKEEFRKEYVLFMIDSNIYYEHFKNLNSNIYN